MIAFAAAAAVLGRFNHAVNFTIPIYDDNIGSNENQTFAPKLNYSSPAQPYYGLTYHNFKIGGGFYGSTVCPGVCTPHPFVWGQVDEHGQIGVGPGKFGKTATFDLNSMVFGCDGLFNGADPSTTVYGPPINCTVTFKGYNAPASTHAKPVAEFSYFYIAEEQNSPFTGLFVAVPTTATLPDTFKNLKYVTLSVKPDPAVVAEAAKYNETVTGTRIMLSQSNYTINRPKAY